MRIANFGRIGRKPRKRWIVLGGSFLALVVGLVAAFPWFLGTAPARRWLLARASQVLAPARLEFSTIQFSWFGPTRLTGFAIRDARGDRVVFANQASWDRNLRQILFERPRLGTFELPQAALDVERSEDGSIDLYEAIKPVLGKNPGTDLNIKILSGTLRLRDAGALAPIEAGRADLSLEIPPAPRPLTWSLALANRDQGAPARIEIDGQFERWKSPNHLAVQVEAKRWPWATRSADLSSTGQLEGRIDVAGGAGEWRISGDANVLDLSLAGARLSGDQAHFDRISGLWRVSASKGAWSVEQLDLRSGVGSILVDSRSNEVGQVTGKLDLAALTRIFPRTLRLKPGLTLEQGWARLKAVPRPFEEGAAREWSVEARITDLEANNQGRRFTLREPATLNANLGFKSSKPSLNRLAIQSAFLNGSGQGDLEAGIHFKGDLNLDKLQEQLDELVDLGSVKVAGQGALTGGFQRSSTGYQGRLAAELGGLKLEGLPVGSLEQDLVRVELNLDGTLGDSGLPQSWSSAKLKLKSDQSDIDLSLNEVEQAMALALSARLPLPSAWSRQGQPRFASGNLEARWEPDGLSIDRLILGLEPQAKNQEQEKANETNPAEGRKGEQPTFAFKGKYERSLDQLSISSLNTGPKTPSPLEIGPDGMMVAGLAGPDPLNVTLDVRGDLDEFKRLLKSEGLGNDLPSLSGPWLAHANLRSLEDGLHLASRLELHPQTEPSPKSSRGPNEEVPQAAAPVRLTLNLLKPWEADRLDLAELTLSTRYATLDGSGEVTDLRGKRLADFQGKFVPNWEEINTMLSQRVEPGAQVSGTPRDWHLKGPFVLGSLDQLKTSIDAEFGVGLTEANIYGLRLGAVALAARIQDGKVTILPIDTSLNGGRIRLEPILETESPAGPSVRLDERSSITNAEINDEVSKRFLSYVAPVLDRATRAHGRVSVSLHEALFPMGGPEKREAKVEGEVVFQDVEFLPGPFLEPLYDLMGRTDRPSLKLNEPVSLQIADRRVYQKGLAIPLGKLTQIELDGWVDFDRNLNLNASLPFTAEMVGDAPVLSALIENKRISVPIRGTIQNPEIDREAFNVALKQFGQSVLTNGAVKGTMELFKQLRRPRDPNAPPPPTFEERRNQRLERRNERRQRRGQAPLNVDPPSMNQP